MYLPNRELLGVLLATHILMGLGGWDRMIKEHGNITNKYTNIASNGKETFLHFCEPCQQKQKGLKKTIVVKPIIAFDFESCCQVALIDFQSHLDGNFKFIMVNKNRCNLTKFVVLMFSSFNEPKRWPITSKIFLKG